MKKYFFLIAVFFLLIFTRFIPKTNAQTRYATCDLCGYCQDKEPPSNWLSCKQCLYPNANDDATSKDTLRVDSSTNIPPTPQPGNYYTMIGCISTSLDSFTNPSAAGSVTQRLLNITFSIGGGIAFLYLIYGSFLILISQADPEKLNHGKRIIYGAVIGIIFTISAVFIVNIIGSNILKLPGFGQ